jgi:hypothetical protein
LSSGSLTSCQTFRSRLATSAMSPGGP